MLADTCAWQRLRYKFEMQPADFVTTPELGRSDSRYTRPFVVYCLHRRKELQETEWMYQLDTARKGGWEEQFQKLQAAVTVLDARTVLEEWLSEHNTDEVALRLLNRLPLWVPRSGVTLIESAEGIVPLDELQEMLELELEA